MAQSWRMPHEVAKALPPYDAATLERAALDYAARYATTRAKLTAYLRRKLRERGWDGDGPAPVEALVARFAERGYVDDRAFASARAEALLRRGYGARRIGSALRAAGIDAETAEGLRERIDGDAEAAALRYARRKRIGPFAARPADPAEKRRWIAAMARAGHPIELVLRLLQVDPDEVGVEP
ncbi:regulatory protein RecX [Rhizorhabdus wittichii]|uniref:Regulatory protein RecX n=2 Tax=Rhizorhabdus wittichii TaxID=160791 RepID=A0A975D0M4_9SPHN|nr:regulatory protein RecX [Rhizorhabdus wittichii]QTH20688.1 regulatory protein RecX [Rhizorhabdus wittichii]